MQEQAVIYETLTYICAYVVEWPAALTEDIIHRLKIAEDALKEQPSEDGYSIFDLVQISISLRFVASEQGQKERKIRYLGYSARERVVLAEKIDAYLNTK